MRSESKNSGFPKDKQLNPITDETQMVTIQIKHKSTFIFKVEKDSPISEIEEAFCRAVRIRKSSVRFIYEGNRVHEDDTPDTLEMQNDDAIEVFTKMTGGGRPEKKNIFGDHAKIIDVLDSLSMSENSDDCVSSDEKDDAVENIQEQSIIKDNMDYESIPCSKENWLLSKKLTKQDPSLFVQFIGSEDCLSIIEDIDIKQMDTRDRANISEEIDPSGGRNRTIDQSITSMETTKFVSDLRKQYNDGKLKEKNPIDQKIIHFLKQPKLAPIEIQILTSLSEQRSFHNQWQYEKDILYPELSTREKTQTVNSPTDKSPINLVETSENGISHKQEISAAHKAMNTH